MERRATIPACILILLMFSAAAGMVRAQGLGVALGANFTSLSDIDTNSGEATFDNANGWHAHVWFDLPLGPIALRPGVRYTDMGALFEQATIENVVTGIDEDEVVSLIEVPIDVRIRMGMPLVSPYLMAGPVLRFPAGSDDDERLESFSLAAGVGLGVELGFGGITLFPELKYTFGITRFTQDEYRIGNVTITPDGDQRLNAIMLSLGIGL